MVSVASKKAHSAIRRLETVNGLACAEFDCAPGRLALPDFACDLIWIGGRLFVVGPMTRGLIVDAQHGRLALVSMSTSQIRRLCGRPIRELTDATVPIDDVAPHLAGPLRDLFAMGESSMLVRSSASTGAAPAPPPADPRVAAAIQALSCGASPGSLTETLNIGQRQLRRIFQDATGLAPGEFQRIRRFRRAIAHARSGASLAQSSVDAGYFDQPHFNHECRQLTGLTPLEVLASLGGGNEVAAVRRTD